MLVNAKKILNKALREGYAIGAYNINNLEWTRFILEACQSDNSPVILAVSEGSVSYFGGYKVVYNVVKSLIDALKITVPVVLHLDHGKSALSCKEAIDAGFTSVMIDASMYDIEKNIEMTNEVIGYAKKKDVSVEAQIGNLGNDDLDSKIISCTNLSDANYFVSATGIDFLAPSVGTKHGIYKESYNIDFELLGAITKETKIPLVLHGASGLDDNKIKTAIFCGVSKININTDLQLAWTRGVKEFLNYNVNEYDPRKIIKSGEKELKKIVYDKNNVLGSKGKAN